MIRQYTKKQFDDEKLLIIINNNIYDVTEFSKVHVGGFLPLYHAASNDVTDLFTEYHSKETFNLLHKYKVGYLSIPNYPSNLEIGRRELRRKLIEQKLYDSNFCSYFFIFLRAFSFLFMTIILLINSNSIISIVGASLSFGLYFQQIAFIGHDCGHNSIFKESKYNRWLGYFVGNLCTGISMSWWNSTHNVHHIVCNSIEHDPDIQHLPLLACNKDIIKSINKEDKIFSSYHNKYIEINNITKKLLSYQHIIFFPLMAVARFNLYAQSWILLFSNSKIDNRFLEILLLFAHFILHTSFVIFLIPTNKLRLLFVLTSHACAGILHVQILLSHYAMKVYNGTRLKKYEDWATTQLDTTMNIESSIFTDWFHGGLQFQIEHHLFPRIPRPNLRKVSELVKPFCKENNLEYKSVSFFNGLKLVYLSLKEAGLYAIDMISDGLNAKG